MTSLSIAVARGQETRQWVLGFVYVVCAASSASMFGWAAAVAGTMIAVLATYSVYLPTTLVLANGGRPLSDDAEPPAVTPIAHAALFALWTATVWLVAAMASVV